MTGKGNVNREASDLNSESTVCFCVCFCSSPHTFECLDAIDTYYSPSTTVLSTPHSLLETFHSAYTVRPHHTETLSVSRITYLPAHPSLYLPGLSPALTSCLHSPHHHLLTLPSFPLPGHTDGSYTYNLPRLTPAHHNHGESKEEDRD